MPKPIHLLRLAVLALSLSSILSAAVTASAQPLTDVQTDQARKLHLEGDEHFGKKEWAKARAAYLGAWALKKHWQIAASLGDTELKLGMHKDAAEHLSIMLAMLPGTEASTKDAGLEMLAKAKQNVVTFNLKSNVEGADVSVGGEIIGKTPLATPLFLAPGTHSIELKKVGYLSRGKTLEGVAGKEVLVELNLEPENGAVEKTPPIVKPPPPEKPLWPTILFGSAAAASLGVGIGLTVAAQGEITEAEDIAAACATPVTNDCIAESEAALDASTGLSAGGYVGFGLAGALLTGMIVYLVIEPSAEETPGARGMPIIVPVISPTHVGLATQLSF